MFHDQLGDFPAKFVESLKKSVDVCKECKEFDNPRPLPEEARDKLFTAYQKALARDSELTPL